MPHTTRKTLGFDAFLFDKLCEQSGAITQTQQAQALGISREHLNTVRNGRRAPGPEFQAAVRALLPDADPRELFPIVHKPSAVA